MKTLEQIKQILQSKKNVYKDQYYVKELYIFGSYTRHDQNENSDIDILVEFEKPVSLLHLTSLENYLSDILGEKIDLVPKKNIREELKGTILKEAIPV